MKELTDRTQKEAAKFGLNINPEKTKIMKVGRWDETEDGKLMTDGREVKSVDAFCYLGSLMTADSSCDREVKVRIGKANATFGRLDKIWKKNGCSIETKIRLYNAIVESTLLYGSETWPMTVARHRWLRRILHVSWRDKITNKSIRERMGQEDMESIIRKRRLWWRGHVKRMDKDRRANQILHWVP